MKTICWDVDNVLNNLIEEWLIYYKYVNLGKYDHIKFNQLLHYNLYNSLNITEKEFIESLDYFTINYYKTLKPNKVILNWFTLYGHLTHNIVLTAFPLRYIEISAQWVLKYYGQWIRSYAFTPLEIREDTIIYDKTKSDYINRMGNIDIFIEDSEKNILNSQATNNLILKRPWNNSEMDEIRLLKEINNLIGVF